MRRSGSESVLSAIVLVMACGGSIAVAQQPGDASGEATRDRDAFCVVRIECDQTVLPLTTELIEALLDSVDISFAPAREILGLQREQQFIVSFEMLAAPTLGPDDRRTPDGVIIGRIGVRVPGDVERMAADKLLKEVCRRLDGALKELGTAQRARTDQRLAAVEAELTHLRQYSEEIRQRRRELLDQAGSDDLSSARVENVTREFEDERARLELDLAGAEAREKALMEQMAKIARDVEAAVEDGGVADELAKVVQIREEYVKRAEALHKEGRISDAELADAQERLAQARAQHIEVREQAQERAGRDFQRQLSHELFEIGLKSAEGRARLAYIGARLDEMRARNLQELAHRYEREIHREMSVTEDAMQELTVELHDIKRQMRETRQPGVTVIGSGGK